MLYFQNLEFSTEKLQQVENEYHDILHKLQTKQHDIDSLQKVQETAREKYESAITSLQTKIDKLESQCVQYASKQEELTEEVTQLRADKAKKSHDIRSAEIQTGNSLDFAPSSTSSPNQSPRNSPIAHVNQSPVITPSNLRKSPATTKGRSPSNNTTPSPSQHVPVLNKAASKNSPSTPG